MVNLRLFINENFQILVFGAIWELFFGIVCGLIFVDKAQAADWEKKRRPRGHGRKVKS